MKRKLSEEEITNILDFIKPNPNIPIDSGLAIVKVAKDRLRKQLETQIIYPEIIPALKEAIKKDYYNSLIQPGESVGVICAQSIGEKQTQTTLNTFHKAGQSEKTMTSGVPRFQELINATKKPKIVNHKIFMKKTPKDLENLREIVGHNIVGLTLNDLSKSIDICVNKKTEDWYKIFEMVYNKNIEDYDSCLKIKFDLDKLYRYKISLEDISKRIESKYEDLKCIFSPLYVGEIHVYVDTNEINIEENVLYVSDENKIEIYMEECVKCELENLNLFGIEGICEIFFVQNDDEWLVETNGINSRTISTQYINFKNLLALEIVDEFKTVSNNVWDIYEVLGIEAARQFLIDEFMSIMEGINKCHTSLLVDRMTYGGSISSITRYTMKKEEIGPFGKASLKKQWIILLTLLLEEKSNLQKGYRHLLFVVKELG